jgi:hypothetical protein
MSNDSEYEKLKTFCDQNGLDVINESGEFSNFFLVVNKKKDIWEGVEFVDCVDGDGSLISPRKIYKVLNNLPGEPSINIRIVDNKLVELSINKKWFKPSTEEAYVNQLKAKAFKLYGEIKDGDFFEFPEQIKCSISLKSKDDSSNWNYTKIYDTLRLHGFLLYEKDQWAKKVPKRIEVKCVKDSWYTLQNKVEVYFVLSAPLDSSFPYKGGEFLAKQLEKYLNGEIETP